MSTKPPADRRKFMNAGDEVNYLRDKLLYWLYARGHARRARPYALRLQRLLPKADLDHETILGEECRSLAFEAVGNLKKAIEHRENEVRLIRRLHRISLGRPFADHIFKHVGYDALSDRLDLLAVLQHEDGDLDAAIRTLRESRRICEEHGAEFDGADLLEDYLKEKREAHVLTGQNGRGTGALQAVVGSSRRTSR